MEKKIVFGFSTFQIFRNFLVLENFYFFHFWIFRKIFFLEKEEFIFFLFFQKLFFESMFFIFFYFLVDLVLLFFVPLLWTLEYIRKKRTSIDTSIKSSYPPSILLLHGSGFDESEWLVGRTFLSLYNNPKYGQVFSLNYDTCSTKGIEDFATNEIRNKCLEIQKVTGQSQIILIGHSMGGLVASYYAEHLSKKDNIDIEHIITIATPWQGTPLLETIWYYTNYSWKTEKRYPQMSCSSFFRKILLDKILLVQANKKEKKIQYYNLYSENDFFVNKKHGLISEQIPHKEINSCGHYLIIVHPQTWITITNWLDQIYSSSFS